jgi:hypothetical protein
MTGSIFTSGVSMYSFKTCIKHMASDVFQSFLWKMDPDQVRIFAYKLLWAFSNQKSKADDVNFYLRTLSD